MQHILSHLIDTLEQGQTVVLCAITRNHGSAPRSSGARMLIREGGASYGSVGGGALEAACQTKAAELLQVSVTFAELNFHLNADAAAKAGMACGGSVSVLLHRAGPDLLPLLRRTQEAYQSGKRPVLLTYLPKDGHPPHLHLLDAGECGIPDDLRNEILRKKGRTPYVVGYPPDEIFVEPLVSPGTVYLAGAGHVAMATARIASLVGFDIVVMDDRPEFANRARYPDAREVRVIDSFSACLPGLGLDDYVVIVTRGHLQDKEVLAQALRTRAGYIGMIGSRRKRDTVYAALRGEGFTDVDLARVHCPIGLAIGADTPDEIALSIVAELIQVRSGMNG